MENVILIIQVARTIGICPSLHYSLENIKNNSEIKSSIKEQRDLNNNVIWHTLEIGEYPKSKVEEKLNKKLEEMYNNGKIKENLIPTGRWYSVDGQKEIHKVYAGKHIPEFEYNGLRYARVVCNKKDGTDIDKEDIIAKWVKVEPISFVIRNWDEMPKTINDKGTGTAKFIDLRAEEVLIANIPFYPNEQEFNSEMWQNSIPRLFLNGIDVRNIESNGDFEYGENKEENFTDNCNFLNEAFNLSREPITEYIIPESETEIPDDAFNGCINLNKITVHPKINNIGERAFDGLNFKYACKLKTGEIIFTKKFPDELDSIKLLIEIEKISRPFVDFNYNILLKDERLEDIYYLAEELNKSKFVIPYVYAEALANSKRARFFCKNKDFRFFKNELPNINEDLLNFSEEERIDFFKFANALGCFSKEKVLDKYGKETETELAQKATSTIVNLLKTDELKLRKIQ